MKKYRVLIDVETQKYYTGDFWDNAWSRDIDQAKPFWSKDNEELVISDILTNPDTNERHDCFDNVKHLEVKTIIEL